MAKVFVGVIVIWHCISNVSFVPAARETGFDIDQIAVAVSSLVAAAIFQCPFFWIG